MCHGWQRLTRAHYRPEIDGLRAIAVMGVLLFHLDLGLPGGYVGVDVFFVISGFLITRLITDQQGHDGFTLTGFWERRLRRLFPALASVLVFTSLAAYMWFLPRDFQQYGESLTAQSALISNVFFWMRAGYFDSTTDLKPLLHTWSLAVEEQFYLLFPLIFLVRRGLDRTRLIGVIALIAAASFVLSVRGSYTHPSAAFYLLPTRAWELALGSLLCFIGAGHETAPAIRRSAAWVGLAGIACAFLFYSAATRFPGVSALLPCGGAALVIWGTTQDEGLAAKILSLRPLVLVGLISYPLYLWHWPLIVFWKYLQPRPGITLQNKMALVAASFLAAFASYYFVEAPVRRRRVLKSTRMLVTSSLATALAFVGVGVMVSVQRGMPWRLPPDCLRLALAQVDPRFVLQTSVDDLKNDLVPALKDNPLASAARHVDVLLWGDSHANSMAALISGLAAARDMTAAMITYPSTAPLLDFWRMYPYSLHGDDAREFSSRTIAYVRNRTVKHVILAAAWAAYASDPRDDPGIPVLSGSAGIFRLQLPRTVAAIQAAGADVWLVKDIPDMGIDVPRALSRVCIAKGDIASLRPSADAYASENAEVNAVIDSLRSRRVHTLDPLPLFVDGRDRLRMEKDSYPLFQDSAHLTTQGAQLLTPLFDELFRVP
jgi:peptidoglycan/LPS O-acetylase OafA/YrhL